MKKKTAKVIEMPKRPVESISRFSIQIGKRKLHFEQTIRQIPPPKDHDAG